MILEQPDGSRNASGLTFGGNLRAAVFGVSDGIISNTSLVLGIAGAVSDPRMVLLSGAAGLLAGALSMGAGEYVSMSSQRELFSAQIAREREELERDPQGEIDQLARIYRSRGVPMPVACKVSKSLSRNPESALQTHTREELGLNPGDLGSPLGAAASSFVSFALGAAVPLVPFLLRAGSASLGLAAALAAASLFGVGVASSALTGQPRLRGGLRMLVIGGSAGAIAYALGTLLGVAL